MPAAAAPGSGGGTEGPGSGVASGAGAVEVLAFIEARGALWRYHRGELPERREYFERLEKLPLSAPRALQLVAELRARPESKEVAQALASGLLPEQITAPRARNRPLAIVADGALAGLPFAALRVGSRWLIQDRTLVYWPALSSIGPERPRDPAPAAGAAAASPVRLPDNGAVVLAATAGRGKSELLAAARREAEEVAALVGARPRVGDAATIAALRESAGAPLLHLAAHGGLAPGGAFVRLADGEVSVSDVVSWRLAPRVVVLASCSSGARPSGSMWGALGGAFLAAGSQSVMATLWSVEDAPTAALVRAFYAAGGALDPARALAVAQRAAIAAGVSPRHWAAFVALAES